MTLRVRIPRAPRAHYTVKVGNAHTLFPDKTRTFVTANHAHAYKRKLTRDGFHATVQPRG